MNENSNITESFNLSLHDQVPYTTKWQTRFVWAGVVLIVASPIPVFLQFRLWWASVAMLIVSYLYARFVFDKLPIYFQRKFERSLPRFVLKMAGEKDLDSHRKEITFSNGKPIVLSNESPYHIAAFSQLVANNTLELVRYEDGWFMALEQFFRS